VRVGGKLREAVGAELFEIEAGAERRIGAGDDDAAGVL
jgi:hypothetical protein